jgi:DNA-binding GntR family transcriptional regulator
VIHPEESDTDVAALSFNRVGTSSFREKVTKELRAAVISGRMSPGKIYSAPALAQEFGVSPTPVREAMVDLVSEGLVETVRNKGYRVTEMSDKELDDVTDLRLLIEPAASRRAISAATAEDVAALRELADRIVDGSRRGDLIQYIDADSDFHLTLLALSGNARIVRTVAELRAHTRLYGLARLAQAGKLESSAAEHHALVDLVAAGDGPGIEAALIRHIGHVRGIWATGQE